MTSLKGKYLTYTLQYKIFDFVIVYRIYKEHFVYAQNNV